LRAAAAEGADGVVDLGGLEGDEEEAFSARGEGALEEVADRSVAGGGLEEFEAALPSQTAELRQPSFDSTCQLTGKPRRWV
jgi:hypothetical protein